MCGIFGVFCRPNDLPVAKEALLAATETMRHRGPDATGCVLPNPETGLGHVRLAILDLDERSNQPFAHRHLTITYNGEVYNYLELRAELEALGHVFRTQSDTEVVIIAYLQWGAECVKRFNGMWAFAIYDAMRDELFCSRDRFGVKPFNYALSKGGFLFGSEIKALLSYDPSLRRPNYTAISQYLRESVGAQAEESWFKGVFRLKPAHNLVVRRGGLRQYRYWNYPEQTPVNLNEDRAREEYLAILHDSVRLRMRSDVPVGLTLSGGLDSSSIACILQKVGDSGLNAYTARFPNETYDELPVAKKLCEEFRFHLTDVVPPYGVYAKTLGDIVYHLESGHASPAVYPLWWVAKRARDDIVVYLEGQGADEMLGGYIESVFMDQLLELIGRGKALHAARELWHFTRNCSLKRAVLLFGRQAALPYFQRIYRRVAGFDKVFVSEAVEERPFVFDWNQVPESYSRLNRRLFEQHQTGLVNLLHYGDAISMAHSLENRLPFMDYRLVEFCFNLPDKCKVHNGIGKSIHRASLKAILPDYIRLNARKIGFESPLGRVLADQQSGAPDVLLSDSLKQRDMFHRSEIERLVGESRNGEGGKESLLFRILSTELWFRRFIDACGTAKTDTHRLLSREP